MCKRDVDDCQHRQEYAEELNTGLHPGVPQARQPNEQHHRVDPADDDKHGERQTFDHDGVFVKRSFARRSNLCSTAKGIFGKNDLPDQEKSVSTTANDRIEVKLNNVVVECRCGVHAWEKHPERPNRLSISVTLFAGLNSRRIEEFGYIDYDQIRDFLKTFPARPHTDLLETILDEIVERCFVDERVDACRVSILKLDIFNEAESAGVEVYRTRTAWT